MTPTIGLVPLEFKDCLTDSPFFRQKLHSHEKELDSTSHALKGLIKDLNSLVTASRSLSQAQRSLSSRLNSFSFECIGNSQTDDEIVISNSLKEFAKLIDLIEDERRRMYNTSFRQIIDQLDNFRKQSIGGAKEGRKKFEKETQKFYQSQDRYLALSTKKDEQILQEADAAVDMEQRHFVQASLDYVLLLQEAQEKKKFEFVEILLSHMYCWLTFYHQGHEVFNECTPYLRNLQERIQKTRENFYSTSQEVALLKNKMIEIEDPGSMDKTFTRQGYLFLLEKKAFGTTWTKHYCQYQKETKCLTMIPYNQIQQKISTADTIRLKQCIRRSQDSIEKRFCLDVIPQQTADKNQPQVYTLQALCEDDCRHWMDAMDGKEHTSIPPHLASAQETTCLDDYGKKFIVKAISVLEKKGLEDQGLYRLVGVGSKVTKLLNLGLDPKRCDELVLDDSLEWETKTITSAIKQYFRNLPEPLMTYALHSKFIEAAKKEKLFDRVSEVHHNVHKLPEMNFTVLKILIQHLCRVSRKSDKNLMTVGNLGVCFGPTLLRPEEETVAAIMDIKFSNIVVELLIEHCDKIFSTDPPTDMDSSFSTLQQTKGRPPRSTNPVVQTVVTSFTTSEPQTVHFSGMQSMQRSDGMANLKSHKAPHNFTEQYHAKPVVCVPPPPSATHHWSSSAPSLVSGHEKPAEFSIASSNKMLPRSVDGRLGLSANTGASSGGPSLSFINPLSEDISSCSSSCESLSSRDILPPPLKSVAHPRKMPGSTLGAAYPPTYQQHMETRASFVGSQSGSAVPKLAGACAVSVTSILSKGNNSREDGPKPRRVRTLYACVGENESELSFEPNQIVTNIRFSKEPGWLEGTLNGKAGLIPENYVKFIDDAYMPPLVAQNNTDV